MSHAYLGVPCHFVDSFGKLRNALLGVVKFSQQHTAANISAMINGLMKEWAVDSKVTCLVTDGAANMVAYGKLLNLRHAICIAHNIMLNLIVKKAVDQEPTLCTIRPKARRIVGYFRSSTSAKVCL